MGQIFPAGDDTPGIQAFVSGYNSTGGTLAIGSIVVWDTADADVKGFQLPATAMGGLMAGVLTEAVLEGADTDKIQRLGVVDALVKGAVDVVLGDSLKPVNGDSALVQDASGALSSAVQGFTSLEAYTDTGAALKSVFVNLPG